jgi:hypothetical protein
MREGLGTALRMGWMYRSATPLVDPTTRNSPRNMEIDNYTAVRLRRWLRITGRLRKRISEPPEGSQQPCERPSG